MRGDKSKSRGAYSTHSDEFNVLDYTFVNQLVQNMNSEVKKEKTFKAPHVV